MYSCTSADDAKDSTSITLLGAGSTFDYPLFSTMFYHYHQGSLQRINYQSIGSGGGIKELGDKAIDFGATDAPLSADQARSMGAAVIHLPITTGAVVFAYNLPELKDTLQLSGPLLARMFMAEITEWNDPAIQAENPHITLPNRPIFIIHRAEASGSTNIFTRYLSAIDSKWASQIGSGSSVKWMCGLGGKNNEGVAAMIQNTPGAVGYIDLAYAMQIGLPFAKIKNKWNQYILPSLQSVTAAAQLPIPSNGIIYLTDTSTLHGYPLCSFSWVVVYKEQQYSNRTLVQATELVKLLQWMVHDGQQYAPMLHYAPLATDVIQVNDALLASITYQGKPILKPQQ